MYRLIKIKFFLLCLCLCWTFSVLASSVPQKINYQGQLLKDGNPVTGIKSIYFSISDSSWFELHSSVAIDNGLYSVVLGNIQPLPASVFDSTDKKLIVSIDGERMSPDIDIVSVAYALKAEQAKNTDNINGNPVKGVPSKNQVLKWDGSAWTPQSDEKGIDAISEYSISSDHLANNSVDTSKIKNKSIKLEDLDFTPQDDLGNHEASQNIVLNGHFISNNGESKGITISNNGDVNLGNLNVSGDIQANSGLNAVNTNGFPFLNGYIKGCQLSWFSDSQVRIGKGLIESGGTLYKINKSIMINVDKHKTEQGMYAIYIDKSNIKTKYITKSNTENEDEDNEIYYKLNVMPEWNIELMGWYHPTNSLDRCIGFFYEAENIGIAPFDYIDGDYLYRVNFGYGGLVHNYTAELKLIHVPSCSRLAIGLAYINAYKHGNCYLYTHPYSASTSTTRVAHNLFYTDNSGDKGGQSISLRTPVVEKDSGVKFSYYFHVHHSNDHGYYILNGFHWKADSQ